MKKTILIIAAVLLVSSIGVLTYLKISNRNASDNGTGKTNDSLIISIISFSKISDEKLFMTGKVERGTVKTGDEVSLVGMSDKIIDTKISSLSSFSGTINNIEDLNNFRNSYLSKKDLIIIITTLLYSIGISKNRNKSSFVLIIFPINFAA